MGLIVAAHVAGGRRRPSSPPDRWHQGRKTVRVAAGHRRLLDQQALAPLEACLARSGLQQKAALVALRSFRRQAAGPEVDEVQSRPIQKRARDRAARRAIRRCARGTAGRRTCPGRRRPDGAKCGRRIRPSDLAATSRCRELARTQAPGSGPLLLVTVLVGSAHDQELVVAALAKQRPPSPSMLFALGSGTRQAADACVQAMDEEDDAKLAAEAFSATGLDLEAERLTEPEPASPDEPIPFERERTSTLASCPRRKSSCLALMSTESSRRDRIAHDLTGGPVTWAACRPARGDFKTFSSMAVMPRRRHAVAFELAVPHARADRRVNPGFHGGTAAAACRKRSVRPWESKRTELTERRSGTNGRHRSPALHVPIQDLTFTLTMPVH